MKDYTDFLNAPDDAPAMKDHSDFLNAPDTYTETKGHKFQQYKPNEPSSIAKLFLKYAPDWMQETATKAATGGYMPEALDVAAGSSGVARGALNMASPGLGEKAFPTKGFSTGTEVDPSSLGYLGGQFIDPSAMLIGGGLGKVVQLAPAMSKGYKTAQAIRAANATRTVGTAAKNVPASVEQALRYGISGAGAGATTGLLSSEGDLTAAGEGAVAGGALGTGLYGLGKLGQIGSSHLGDFISGKSGKVNAGKIARQVEELSPGSNLRTALENADPNLTAAQAAAGVNNNPFQALGAAAAENDKTSFYTALKARQAAAREGMLSGATPDLVAAEATRKAQMTTGMDAARTAANNARLVREASVMPPQPTVTPTPSNLQPGMTTNVVTPGPVPTNLPGIPGIDPLKVNPVFQALIADAKRMANARTGLPAHLSRLTEDQLADIKADPTKSLEGLQMMKAALDAKFSKTPLKDSALDAFDEEAITKVKKAMLGAVDTAIPEYGAARATYAANSAPVNQAKVLEVLRQKLVNPTNPAEQRTGPFLAALDRGEESALRAAGLNTRFNESLGSALTPPQFQTVNQIASELSRDAAMKPAAAAGAKPLADIVGDTLGKTMKLPGYIDPKVTAYNKFVDFMTGKVTQKTIDALSEGMKSGKSAIEMLNTLPLGERNRTIMVIGQLGKISPEFAALAGEMQSNKGEK